MAGASGILPQLMRARETTAQLYLASFIIDEARHFEALTRLYRALGHDPLGLRDIRSCCCTTTVCDRATAPTGCGAS